MSENQPGMSFKRLLRLNFTADFFLSFPGAPDEVLVKPSFEVHFQSHCGAASMKDLIREFMRKATEVQKRKM